MIRVGPGQSYFQLVDQDSIWYVAMYIQASVRLRDGSREVHTGDSGGGEMPEHKAGVEYYAVRLSWQPCFLGPRSLCVQSH